MTGRRFSQAWQHSARTSVGHLPFPFYLFLSFAQSLFDTQVTYIIEPQSKSQNSNCIVVFVTSKKKNVFLKTAF